MDGLNDGITDELELGLDDGLKVGGVDGFEVDGDIDGFEDGLIVAADVDDITPTSISVIWKIISTWKMGLVWWFKFQRYWKTSIGLLLMISCCLVCW